MCVANPDAVAGRINPPGTPSGVTTPTPEPIRAPRARMRRAAFHPQPPRLRPGGRRVGSWCRRPASDRARAAAARGGGIRSAQVVEVVRDPIEGHGEHVVLAAVGPRACDSTNVDRWGTAGERHQLPVDLDLHRDGGRAALIRDRQLVTVDEPRAGVFAIDRDDDRAVRCRDRERPLLAFVDECSVLVDDDPVVARIVW